MAKSKVQVLEKDVAILEEKVQKKLLKVVDKMTELGLREYTKYLSSPGRVFLMNLLAGIARGFGFFLGATVVVALVTVILTKVLGSIPWLTDFVQWTQEALDPNNLQVIKNFDFLKDTQGNIIDVIPKISN